MRSSTNYTPKKWLQVHNALEVDAKIFLDENGTLTASSDNEELARVLQDWTKRIRERGGLPIHKDVASNEPEGYSVTREVVGRIAPNDEHILETMLRNTGIIYALKFDARFAKYGLRLELKTG